LIAPESRSFLVLVLERPPTAITNTHYPDASRPDAKALAGALPGFAAGSFCSRLYFH
jgi:hypothetical protein